MEAYRIETTIQPDGTLTVSDLPLQGGEEVEVIILVRSPASSAQVRSSLRGLPVVYHDPFAPAVPESEWESLK